MVENVQHSTFEVAVMTRPRRYNTVAIALHWTLALLIIFMVLCGERLTELEDDGVTASTFLPSLHVSIGVTILVLPVLRLVWRLMNPPPPLPVTIKPWEVGHSHAMHLAFYVLLIGIPLLGWLAIPEFLTDEPAMSAISAFGVGLPQAPDFGIDAKEFQEIGSNIVMALVILHALAALKHQFVDRDALLKRMRPL